jgi:hypothetical protein
MNDGGAGFTKAVGASKKPPKCFCDPICDYCEKLLKKPQEIGESLCLVKNTEVDWCDDACPEFSCKICGRKAGDFNVGTKKT